MFVTLCIKRGRQVKVVSLKCVGSFTKIICFRTKIVRFGAKRIRSNTLVVCLRSIPVRLARVVKFQASKNEGGQGNQEAVPPRMCPQEVLDACVKQCRRQQEGDNCG